MSWEPALQYCVLRVKRDACKDMRSSSERKQGEERSKGGAESREVFTSLALPSARSEAGFFVADESRVESRKVELD